MQKTEAQEAAALLRQHGVLEEQQLATLHSSSVEELQTLLKKQVLYLLERDFERLLQALYRIDVPEQRFKEALVAAEDPAATITDLILQRELQKVKTRRWYASRNSASLE